VVVGPSVVSAIDKTAQFRYIIGFIPQKTGPRVRTGSVGEIVRFSMLTLDPGPADS
jgi:hypothetical protein